MDKNSQEIDAIIRLHNGKYGLVEIILGAHMADDAAKNLLRFAEKIDTKHAPAPRANSFEGIQSTEEMPLLTDIHVYTHQKSRRQAPRAARRANSPNRTSNIVPRT